ncbi:MAG: hydroxymethylpyrimidine/phosphomethylpyrimidine kinase [Paludibacteraceae bacterium]|nr:hydroxymethylpyrimidine/phosphomethylpyrimidine kinase [Paludibacteraceae bacterium]
MTNSNNIQQKQYLYPAPPPWEGAGGRPFVLSIAGHDPCGGAGVLADIKVFDHLGLSGLGVVSALTFQNDSCFEGVKWCTLEEIEKQLSPLRKYPVKAVKIGLIENFEHLQQVVDLVRNYFSAAYLVWDPILKASAGFRFHSETSFAEGLSKKINLITPNYEEYLQLQLDKTPVACPVLLKGGHRDDKKGIDMLYSNGKETEIPGIEFKDKHDKHGTGCVLSAAIAGYVALGFPELEACTKAKSIVEQLILSNETKLGYLSR